MIIRFLIVIGVSGSGKTSVGNAHAEALRWHFYNADDFHPAENVAKMAGGFRWTIQTVPPDQSQGY